MATSPAFACVLSSKVTMVLQFSISYRRGSVCARSLLRSSTDGGRRSERQSAAGRAAPTAEITSFLARLLALARNAIERLRQPLHRKGVGALQAAIRRALEHQIAALAHRFDQFCLVSRILDPGAVGLGGQGKV